MVLKKLYGLKGTGITLNERFTILSSSVPHQTDDAFMQPNIRNRGYLQIADRLDQGNRHVLSHRLGMNESGRLRRTGSESTLPGLKRSNSYSSLNQERSVKQRIGWRQPKRNLSRSASLNNLAGLFSGVSPQPAYRRRAAAQRVLRSKFGDGQDFYRIQTAAQQLLELAGVQVPYFVNRGVSRGGARGGARGSARGAAWGGARGGAKGSARGHVRPGAKGSARGGTRGRGRIRGRGGAPHNNSAPMLTKEELDAQLEQYMAGSKAALDRELETYMKNAMDLE